jgi:hypothetical protein
METALRTRVQMQRPLQDRSGAPAVSKPLADGDFERSYIWIYETRPAETAQQRGRPAVSL